MKRKIQDCLASIYSVKMKSSSKFLCLTFLLACLSLALSAQPAEKRFMRKGNILFHKKDYAQAEVNYRKTLELNPQNTRARYNLGNALLSGRKPKDAMKQYEMAAKAEKNPFYRAAVYHNMGVILQSQKQFGPAIECYKQSLRDYPQDDRTRYNLALCQYQLKKNPQNKNQQQKKNQSNKNKQNNQKDKQKQQKQQQDQRSQQQQKTQMSKENAEQMLRAAMMEENRTQQKVRKALQNRRQRNVEQNW